MKRAVAVWLAALAAAPALAAAQAQPAALKIAFVNSREILQRTPGYASAESTYLKDVQGYRDEVQRLQQQLDSAVQAFDQQSIALSPAAKQAKQRDLQALQQRMEQRSNQLQDQAQQRERELLSPIQARVKTVIEGIRAELNYSVVFDADSPGGGILSFDPALNITPRVLRRLQQAQ